jgi:hypothetical protein
MVRYDGLLNLGQSKGYCRLTHPTLIQQIQLDTPVNSVGCVTQRNAPPQLTFIYAQSRTSSSHPPT